MKTWDRKLASREHRAFSLSPNLSYLIENIASRIRKVNNLIVQNEMPQVTTLKKGWIIIIFFVGSGYCDSIFLNWKKKNLFKRSLLQSGNNRLALVGVFLVINNRWWILKSLLNSLSLFTPPPHTTTTTAKLFWTAYCVTQLQRLGRSGSQRRTGLTKAFSIQWVGSCGEALCWNNSD